jgi:phenol 2-monooxygenase
LGLVALTHCREHCLTVDFARASDKFGAFITGIGVQYGPSSLVNVEHQGCASKLVIGQRMLPQKFVRAADGLPVEIQDMLPADVRFKVLVFTGIPTDTQIANVNSLAVQLRKPSSFLQKYAVDGNVSSVFDIITIVASIKEEATFLVVPLLFRPHWFK